MGGSHFSTFFSLLPDFGFLLSLNLFKGS